MKQKHVDAAIPSFADAHYSVAHNNVFDTRNRLRVARQVKAVLQDFLKRKNLKTMTCLDVGCSTGIITQYLARFFKKTTGVDIDPRAIARAKKRYSRRHLNFLTSSGMNLPFKSHSFDIVICNETLTYVAHQPETLAEIYRVLRPGGVCFLTVDNQIFPIESQYKLPFLHWLPPKVAQAWLHFLGHKNYYLAKYLTYWQLQNLCQKFIIHDFTTKILQNPIRYQFVRIYKYAKLFKSLRQGLLELLKFFVPTFVFLLVKPYGEISRRPNTRRRG